MSSYGSVASVFGEISLVLQPTREARPERTETREAADDPRLTEIEALAPACKAGDAAAWTALFPLVWPVLVTFVHRLYRSFELEDAEDVAQSSLESAIGAIGSYSGHGLFRAWLFGIAAKQAATFHRAKSAQKRGRELQVPLDCAADHKDPHAKSPRDISAANERAAILHRAIEELAEPDRELVHLHFFGELTFEQVGHAVRMNPKSVCTRLTRCKRQLLTLLKRSNLTSSDG
jgi:RNA polymerase sigma-70 factor (ECF subfamily)